MNAEIPPAVPSALPRMRDWLRRPGNAVFALTVLVNAVLILYTAVVTLQRFPNAGDEYACLVSAKAFLRGQFSVPSPPAARFFDHFHILNDGRYYGKYPPGWPLVLAFGEAFGVPWLVNPVLGLATLFLVRALARRHFSETAAAYAVVTFLVNPFFVFNSASHFSHSSCLFFVILCMYGFFNWSEAPGSFRDALWVGVGAGMAFLIRPFTGVLLLAPFAVVMVVQAARKGWPRPMKASVGTATGISLLFLGFFLFYNWALTGHPLLQPFTLYLKSDHPSLPAGGVGWWNSFVKFSGQRALEMNWPWFRFCLLAALFALVHPVLRKNAKVRMLLASLATLFIGYGFYPADGGIAYGPRYAYESIGAFALLMGSAYACLPKAAPWIAGSSVLLNVVMIIPYSGVQEEIIRGKRDVFERAREEKLSNAIVFFRTGSGHGHPGDLMRNGIDFNGPVLFVRDLGEKNHELLRAFPHRKAYYYVDTGGKGKGRLIPAGPLHTQEFYGPGPAPPPSGSMPR